MTLARFDNFEWPSDFKSHKSENEGYLLGWVCLKCGKVYSPYTHGCLSCNNDFTKINVSF